MNFKTTRRPVENRRATCLIESLESRELFAVSQPLTPPDVQMSSIGSIAAPNTGISMNNTQFQGASIDKLSVFSSLS